MSAQRLTIVRLVLPAIVLLVSGSNDSCSAQAEDSRWGVNAIEKGRFPFLALWQDEEGTGALEPDSKSSEPRSRETESDKKNRVIELNFVYESWEYDEVTLDDVSGSDFDIEELERKLIGLEFRGGPPETETYVRLFFQTLDDGESPTGVPRNVDVKSYGLGFGLEGTPDLIKFDEIDSSIFLDYGLAASFIYGRGDLGRSDLNLLYLELFPRLGLGWQTHGVEISGGAQASYIFGFYRLDNGVDEDDIFTGFNPAPFFGLGLNSERLPLVARLDFLFGDLDGLALTVGVRF